MPASPPVLEAATVTVCGVSQLAVVKVRVSVMREISVVQIPAMEMVTSVVG